MEQNCFQFLYELMHQVIIIRQEAFLVKRVFSLVFLNRLFFVLLFGEMNCEIPNNSWCLLCKKEEKELKTYIKVTWKTASQLMPGASSSTRIKRGVPLGKCLNWHMSSSTSPTIIIFLLWLYPFAIATVPFSSFIMSCSFHAKVKV